MVNIDIVKQKSVILHRSLKALIPVTRGVPDWVVHAETTAKLTPCSPQLSMVAESIGKIRIQCGP